MLYFLSSTKIWQIFSKLNANFPCIDMIYSYSQVVIFFQTTIQSIKTHMEKGKDLSSKAKFGVTTELKKFTDIKYFWDPSSSK